MALPTPPRIEQLDEDALLELQQRVRRDLRGQSRRRATKTTGGVKRDASTRSAGARRQARKDSH